MQVLARPDFGPTRSGDARPPTGLDQLGILLTRAAELEVDHGSAWSPLRADAIAVLDALVDAGQLPAHLVVDPDDPPAVVARAIVAAWRRSTGRAHAPRRG